MTDQKEMEERNTTLRDPMIYLGVFIRS